MLAGRYVSQFGYRVYDQFFTALINFLGLVGQLARNNKDEHAGGEQAEAFLKFLPFIGRCGFFAGLFHECGTRRMFGAAPAPQNVLRIRGRR